ncbi:MAG: chondroitinase-B domain-containing protein, partial [Myxococcota bacterium]
VYDGIATGEQSLLALVATATRGAVIGIASPTNGDDYQGMAEVEFTADDLVIRPTLASSAVIRGATCIVFSGDNIIVDGLIFDALDLLAGSTCDANGDSSIYLRGRGIVVKNSVFRGEAEPRTVPRLDPYNYISIRGVANTIERNVFEGKDMDLEGSAVTLFAGLSDSNRSHVIQYNLFRKFLGKSDDPSRRISTAFVLQLGRTSGMDAAGEGLMTVQYNRFDKIEADRRIIRVQSSSNFIQDNTIVNSLGMISLDDGFGTTVRRNVIVANGEDIDEGGISFAPLRHTIVDNYINNLATDSILRAGLVVNHEPLSRTGNRAIIEAATDDLQVVVARNSIVNTRQPILLEPVNCMLFAPVLLFERNLVMNQSLAMSINGNDNGSGRPGILDSAFATAGCRLSPATRFVDNHVYSSQLSQTGMFTFNGASQLNVSSGQDGASFTRDLRGLVVGTGPDTDIGVNPAELLFISEEQVGPGSTWIAPQ